MERVKLFLVNVKTVITEALKNTFTASYPTPDFASLHISIEYPYDVQDYPGIWVGFEPIGNLSRSGVDEQTGFTKNVNGTFSPFTLWRYQGYATYTIGAMTSLQRDRLFDELCRIFAFSQESSEIYQFRQYVESNPYVAMNMDFDNVQVRGMSESPGTPWGSEDMIYETTIAMECVGEFRNDRLSDPLYPISEVVVEAETPDQNRTLTVTPTSTQEVDT
jgi:hypothetical protein